MTASWTIPAPTTVLRDWLRDAALACGEAVYAGGLPESVDLPAIAVHRISGAVDEPLDLGVYQFDCWATTGPTAEQLAYEIVSLLVSTAPTDITGLRFAGATVESVVAAPDPAVPDQYRYAVTAQVVTVPTT